jgi:hypothetical protein
MVILVLEKKLRNYTILISREVIEFRPRLPEFRPRLPAAGCSLAVKSDL